MPLFELTPVLPPTDESTCASSVDGKLIKLTPLFKMLATNPAKSPIIPPPAATIVSFLLKLFFNNFSTKSFALLKDFKFSLG